MLKRSWLLIAVFAIGFFAGLAWRSVSLLDVHAEGELQYEKPQDPAVTPTYPPGFYVLSRVYLSGAEPSLLGTRVVATGALGTHGHPETPTYPLVPFKTAASTSR